MTKPNTKTIYIPNPEYTTWLEKKNALEADIETIEGTIEGYDKEADGLKEKCKLILGEEADIEKLIKQFERKQKKPGGNTPPPPGGNGGGSTEPTSEKPTTELPDYTQEQLEYYKGLTSEQLQTIADRLSTFSETKNLTVGELLFNEDNATLLSEYLQGDDSLPKELIKLIKEGNTKSSQKLLSSVIYGGVDLGVIRIGDDSEKFKETYSDKKEYLISILGDDYAKEVFGIEDIANMESAQYQSESDNEENPS